MIEPVMDADLREIRALIESAVRESVATSNEDAEFLVTDILGSLKWWQDHKKESIHLKYSSEGNIVGVILVKEFWNLANLFVLPTQFRRGIGCALLQEVIGVCKELSPRDKIQANSSTNAVKFYEAMGFKQTGPGKDRPGGCVPFEYGF